VPECVFSLICKHELLHTQVRPREVAGQKRFHPPEFWDSERRLAPERTEAWRWLWENVGECLVVRPKVEGVYVKRNWKALLGVSRPTRKLPPPDDLDW